MPGILTKSLSTGIVTTRYPDTPAHASPHTRGRPEIDWPKWNDARSAAAVCPTAAIACNDAAQTRTVTFDLAKCVFCGLCADTDKAIRMSNVCECAARHRNRLVATAQYGLNEDGTHRQLIAGPDAATAMHDAVSSATRNDSIESLGRQIQSRAARLFGRSLHIREVDAGSCNGCEIEIVGLTSPVYDIERFGIHFVASPRHADMLLVTGPVTRNMELALKKTYDATPEPRLVVAVGACGCSGGIFGVNYATRGAVDTVIPVDVYIPGCPPNPQALLHGILMAIERTA
ncbi:MAG TPA: NADH-quinone oxidoreductase subunit NuoB [Verrucomicrobiota bacterium]|nr:NADH-quinone oxidoreductase subunit NuoB [Verrucomicrobiota bacterium]HRZ38612.1 NADH-quinone oxidoreductase subunit NuoB [Candidatus Paceibacterota bacterium]HRZ58925.1 NADH-quinone oxidoreductase subunit NuoB [Candidatus Paceibacterota bacterium]